MWCYDKCKYILQEDAICGQVISEEIIIGPMTRINEFPWVALLQYTDGSFNQNNMRFENSLKIT